MFAKNLEKLFWQLSANRDASQTDPLEFEERFRSLRAYGKLPEGRKRRAQALSLREISAAILGLVATRPSWAGHVSLILGSMKPVGGLETSFFGASTLEETIEYILGDENARQSIVQLNVSAAESGTNSNGYSTLIYDCRSGRRRIFFIPKYALSLMQPGQELTFDPDDLHSALAREVSFTRPFFERVSMEFERAKLFPSAPQGDGTEYDDEEAQQERCRKLGVRPNSRFINIGVDNQVTWPNKETLVKFDRYRFVLVPMPKNS